MQRQRNGMLGRCGVDAAATGPAGLNSLCVSRLRQDKQVISQAEIFGGHLFRLQRFLHVQIRHRLRNGCVVNRGFNMHRVVFLIGHIFGAYSAKKRIFKWDVATLLLT